MLFRSAVNDWWGMSTGAVDILLGNDLPEGIKRLSNYLQNGIINGTIDPFLVHIRDQKGNDVSDGVTPFPIEEMMQMNWLCGNVEGSIPQFEELLPQSRNLVRLLRIYRETIPPEVEEALK